MIGFIVGLFLGVLLGVFLIAILVVSKEEKDRYNIDNLPGPLTVRELKHQFELCKDRIKSDAYIQCKKDMNYALDDIVDFALTADEDSAGTCERLCRRLLKHDLINYNPMTGCYERKR